MDSFRGVPVTGPVAEGITFLGEPKDQTVRAADISGLYGFTDRQPAYIESNLTSPQLFDKLPNESGFSDITEIDRSTLGVLELVDGTRHRVYESGKRFCDIGKQEIAERRAQIAQLEREIDDIQAGLDERRRVDADKIAVLDPALEDARQLRKNASDLAVEIGAQLAPHVHVFEALGNDGAELAKLQDELAEQVGVLAGLRQDFEAMKQHLEDAETNYQLIRDANDDLVADDRQNMLYDLHGVERNKILESYHESNLEAEYRALGDIAQARNHIENVYPQLIHACSISVEVLRAKISMLERNIDRSKAGLEVTLTAVRDETQDARQAIMQRASRLNDALTEFAKVDWQGSGGRVTILPAESLDAEISHDDGLPNVPVGIGSIAVTAARKIMNRTSS